MRQVLKIIFALGLVLALSASASASLIPGTVPGATGVNDAVSLFGGTQIGGYYGAQLYLFGGPADILLEYFGAEAGYHNEFNFNGSEVFDHPGGNTIPGALTAISSANVNNVPSGLLNFSFDFNNNAGTVANGSNPDNTTGSPNFFVSFDPWNQNPGGPTSGQSVWLFLDDGGANVDDDHDDMVVKLSIRGGSVSVPEPGTMLLVGAGLFGLGALRRRVKN